MTTGEIVGALFVVAVSGFFVVLSGFAVFDSVEIAFAVFMLAVVFTEFFGVSGLLHPFKRNKNKIVIKIKVLLNVIYNLLFQNRKKKYKQIKRNGQNLQK